MTYSTHIHPMPFSAHVEADTCDFGFDIDLTATLLYSDQSQDCFGTRQEDPRVMRYMLEHQVAPFNPAYFKAGDALYEDDPPPHVPAFVLPIYGCSHSTTSISMHPRGYGFGDRPVGVAFITRERAKESGLFSDFDLTQRITDDVRLFDQYLTGDVWSVSILDANGDAVASLGQCYGYKYAVAESLEMLKMCCKQHAKDTAHEQAQRDFWANNNVRTVT